MMDSLPARSAQTAALPAGTADDKDGPSTLLLTVLTLAAGALIANLYYAQPLVGTIGPQLGISPDLAGSVVSVTQISYGLGLFFLVSLADLIENKTLVLLTLGLTCLGLVGAALSANATLFFIASFVIGLCSTGAQVLIPLAAHLAPEARRGRIVGNVMAGVLTGVMLARPVSLFIAGAFGWRAVFGMSAVLVAVIGVALFGLMPRHEPQGRVHYGKILLSMAGLMCDLPALRRRSAYQALIFGAFNMFWTAVPLMLAAQFGLTERGIAVFALAGCGGALAAPVAGRLADRGLIPISTAGAMLVLAAAFFVTQWTTAGVAALVLLAVAAILIDGAAQTNHVLSQRIIFSVPGEIRGRVNALYMTSNFIGGALGSVLGTFTYHHGGWHATALTGAAIGAVALLLWTTEPALRQRFSGRGA
jgi:predicted MFS family arabinose efflux permease